jgi:glycerol-3-phosphate acyltransferase PlsY
VNIGTGMKVVCLTFMVMAGYLSGSLSWAIIVTKLATGKDIRELGNRNAGTSNVKRSVGIQYAIIVFFLDVAKAVIPMYLARTFLFPGDGYLDILAVFVIGMAAIAGHCRPVYFGFRGGGGITSSLGVFLFFAPLEFLLTLAIACSVVFFFIRNVQRRLTQWLPIIFVTLAPLVLLAANLSLNVRLSEGITFGGHPWPAVVGTFAVAFFILGMNWNFMGRRAEEIRGGPQPN